MQTAPRCKAHARSGEQCKNRPIKGATVCRMHGGSTPGVKAKAKARVAEKKAIAEAQRMVARSGVDMDPVEHLVESLHLAAQLVNVWGAMAAEIDAAAERENQEDTRGGIGYEENTETRSPRAIYELNVFSRDRLLALNRHGEAQVHPFVERYETALDRWGKFSKMAIDAGVAVRQVELTEHQVTTAHEAFEAGLSAVKLTDAQRQEARRAYADRLRKG